MKKFIINVDEKDPEFRKYVAKRVELAKDPKHQITWEELEKRINIKLKKRQEARKHAQQIQSSI
jgi:hypothetical protein